MSTGPASAVPRLDEAIAITASFLVGDNNAFHLVVLIGAGSWSGTLVTMSFTCGKGCSSAGRSCGKKCDSMAPFHNEDLLGILVREIQPHQVVILANDAQYEWLHKILSTIKSDLYATGMNVDLRRVEDQSEMNAVVQSNTHSCP
jgi:hypothetical protein